jgi:voltage-gated potassium channel
MVPEANYFRRIVCLGGVLLGIIVVACVGYMLIEGWTWTEALYMTVITISTVGYGEIHALSDPGRLWTATVILGGVSLVAYTLGVVTQMIVEGRLYNVLGRKIMENKLRKLKEHIIVCGFGRISKILCLELDRAEKSFIVVEEDPEVAREASNMGYLVIVGNATEEEILRNARVENAEGLVSTISSDAVNVFITLEARDLNPGIFIVNRSYLHKNVKHLQRAGADRVISPDVDGGHRMAQAVLRSAVHEFLDLTHRQAAMELLIDEVRVKERCPWIGRSIAEADIRRRTGLIIVAIKRGHEEMIFNPPPETRILEGDTFVTLGAGSHQEMFEKLMEA